MATQILGGFWCSGRSYNRHWAITITTPTGCLVHTFFEVLSLEHMESSPTAHFEGFSSFPVIRACLTRSLMIHGTPLTTFLQTAKWVQIHVLISSLQATIFAAAPSWCITILQAKHTYTFCMLSLWVMIPHGNGCNGCQSSKATSYITQTFSSFSTTQPCVLFSHQEDKKYRNILRLQPVLRNLATGWVAHWLQSQ